MPREGKFDGMEPGDGGGLYLPEAPEFILHADLHSELKDYDLDEEFELTMVAKVKEKRSDGTYNVELTQIEVPRKSTAVDRAKEEVEGPLGVISGDNLKGIFE